MAGLRKLWIHTGKTISAGKYPWRLLVLIIIFPVCVQATPEPTHVSGTEATQKKAVYQRMLATCKRWQEWYRKDKNAGAHLQMTISCRDAQAYAEENLQISPNLNLSRIKPPKRSSRIKQSTAGKAVLVGASNAKSPACQSIQLRIHHIQAQLRAGYTASKGARLKSRRRELRAQYRAHCR